MLLRAGAVIKEESNSTGFPRADLLMPSSHQRAISPLLANGWKLAGFLWQYASLKIGRGQPSGQLLLHFMGTLEAHVLVCRGFGEKSLRSGVMLALGQKKPQDKTWISSEPGRDPKEPVLKKILSAAMEVCRTHTQQKPLSNAYSRTTWRCLPVGSHPLLWFDSCQEWTSIIASFYFGTTTITDTQGIGKILPLFCFLPATLMAPVQQQPGQRRQQQQQSDTVSRKQHCQVFPTLLVPH